MSDRKHPVCFPGGCLAGIKGASSNSVSGEFWFCSVYSVTLPRLPRLAVVLAVDQRLRLWLRLQIAIRVEVFIVTLFNLAITNFGNYKFFHHPPFSSHFFSFFLKLKRYRFHV